MGFIKATKQVQNRKKVTCFEQPGDVVFTHSKKSLSVAQVYNNGMNGNQTQIWGFETTVRQQVKPIVGANT